MNIGLQPDIPMKVGSSANFQNTKLNDSIERKTFKSCAAFYCNYSCISPPPNDPGAYRPVSHSHNAPTYPSCV